MSGLDLLLSAIATLALHATVLLGAVWLAERAGVLKHPDSAESAWRAALLLALVSTSLQVGQRVAEGASALPAPAVAAGRAAPAGTAGAPVHAPRTFAEGRGDVAPADAGSTGTTIRWSDTRDARAIGEAVEAAGSGASGGIVRPGTYDVPPVAAGLILLAWLVATGTAAVRLARDAFALRRLGRQVRRDGTGADAATRADLAHAAAVLGIAPPSLHVVDGIASPMLLPARRLLLPAWIATLSAGQRRALLAHELAHLQRRDPTWRVLQRIAVLPLAFHPLAWHALARLDALAEDACDGRAARLAGSGRPLAECLAACLAHAQVRRAPYLAVAMADRPGPVVRRVRNLLEETPMSDRPVPPALRRTALVVAVCAAIALPGVAITTFASRAFADGITSRLSLDGDRYSFSTTRAGYALRMDVRGGIDFNAAETDVVRLGPGARLTLVEDVDGVEREVVVFGKDGVIQRQYRVDGDLVAFDGEGRAWFAERLPEVLRETGFDADKRGKRILAAGGAPALLAEIARIESDHARGRYLGVLFAHAPLDDAQTDRALALAAAIESDFELRNALVAAVDLPEFDAAKLARVLDAAGSIESDFERRQVLQAAAPRVREDAAALAAWFALAADVGSDFERRESLIALMKAGPVDVPLAVAVLRATDGVGSDFEAGQILEALAARMPDDASLRERYRESARKLGDFERGRAERALDRFAAG